MTHHCIGTPCWICYPHAAQPWGTFTIYPQTYQTMCNCGALTMTANAMGYPPSHGTDCPMCPPTERWLKLRIRELEAKVAELSPPRANP